MLLADDKSTEVQLGHNFGSWSGGRQLVGSG